MWFDSWSDIARVILVSVAAYAAVVIFIRISGKRTLTQLNAFDFIVTVALGSTLATILLSSDVSYLEGVTALLALVVLQIIVAFATSRLPRVRALTTSAPTLLVWQGRFDDTALKRQRVSRADVEQAVRRSGEGDLTQVAAVVLESSGHISVIPMSKLGNGSSLGDLVPPASTAGGR